MANGDSGHAIYDVLLDSLAAGGAAFFGTLSGMSLLGIMTQLGVEKAFQVALLAAFISTGTAFFASIRPALKRAREHKARRR